MDSAKQRFRSFISLPCASWPRANGSEVFISFSIQNISLPNFTAQHLWGYLTAGIFTSMRIDGDLIHEEVEEIALRLTRCFQTVFDDVNIIVSPSAVFFEKPKKKDELQFGVDSYMEVETESPISLPTSHYLILEAGKQSDLAELCKAKSYRIVDQDAQWEWGVKHDRRKDSQDSCTV